MKTPRRERAINEYLLYCESEKNRTDEPLPYPVPIGQLLWMCHTILDQWQVDNAISHGCKHQYVTETIEDANGAPLNQESCIKCHSPKAMASTTSTVTKNVPTTDCDDPDVSR